jgi:hypothetical protein
MVESRGRTGRKPTAAEKSGKPSDPASKKQDRLDKANRPPTWRGAFIKAMFATVVLLLFAIVFLKQSNQAIGLFPVVLAMYTLISYFTDKWMYDRRQRKKSRAGGGGKTAPR